MIDFIELHRRRLADVGRRAAVTMEQLSQEDLNWRPNPDSNSIATLVLHLNGNLRWRVGEWIGRVPYSRNRDAEFDTTANYAKEELLRIWTEVLGVVDRDLAALTVDRLAETVVVRNRVITLAETLVTVTAHTSEHVGQMIYIAKLRLGSDFKTLSIQRKRNDPQGA